MPKYDFAPTRRRRSPLAIVLAILGVLLVLFAIYLSTVDSSVPVQRIEQDVTNEVVKS